MKTVSEWLLIRLLNRETRHLYRVSGHYLYPRTPR